MKPNMGEKLKSLRLSKGFTQEQLAEALGVSAQSVSRWENGVSCPDISMLPGLAMFFETSVDDILGMEEIRKAENINRIHGEINALVQSGQQDKAVELIRESLKIYPNNLGLLMSLGETLAHCEDEEATREAIAIGVQILSGGNVSTKARATTAANLLFLFMRMENWDDARALIRMMPHIWESREMLMPEIYQGEEYRDALKQSIVKALVYFCMKIEAEPERDRRKTPEYIQLGVDFTPTKTPQEMLTEIGRFLNS